MPDPNPRRGDRALAVSRASALLATGLLLCGAVYFAAEASSAWTRQRPAIDDEVAALTRGFSAERERYEAQRDRISGEQSDHREALEASRQRLEALTTAPLLPEPPPLARPEDVEGCEADVALARSQAKLCQTFEARLRGSVLYRDPGLRDTLNTSYKLICEDAEALFENVAKASEAACLTQKQGARLREHLGASEARLARQLETHRHHLGQIQAQMDRITTHQQALSDLHWRRQQLDGAFNARQREHDAALVARRRIARRDAVQGVGRTIALVEHGGLFVVCLLGCVGAGMRLLHLIGGYGALRLTEPGRREGDGDEG